MMDIKIYQINLSRDDDRVAFLGLSQIDKFQESSKVNSEIYDKVFERAVEVDTLEGVYQMFNCDWPEDFQGHSLSVSDVVEIVNGENAGFYFCDSIGFQPVKFEPEQTQKLDTRTMRVVLVEPGKAARVAEIDGSLEGMQKTVSGYIQAVYPFEETVCLVCNEEGKLEGLPLNRALRDEDGDIYDVVAGTFMVVGLTDDSFGSLTVEQMQKFSDHFKVPEQFVKLSDKIVAIPMISKEQQKQEATEQKDFEMNADTSGLTVAGHIGTWHTIDQHEVGGHSFYLMEHDTYGDEAACIIVDERGKLVLDDVYNGFDDDTLRLLDLEVKEVPEMPDPALSVQDMKDYGYAWAGVLPAGQEAAEKALEKGCEVYRLYSDNTEGLCVDAKEIADHAAKGGMLGISKESWMAALEKENYLKAAEMSMEDDYGMIDGIINNGPKEDKTAEVKAPERGEKSSIMDRLKSAKAEKQEECCPPQKHKGEIEL